MAQVTQAARHACRIQKALMDSIESPETEGKDRAVQAREWRELEYAKREWRGVPRMLAMSVKEVMDAIKGRSSKPTELNAPTFVEVETIPQTKESLNSQTVPTPPTPDALMGGGPV